MKKIDKKNWNGIIDSLDKKNLNIIDEELLYEKGKEEEYFIKLQEKLWKLKQDIVSQINMID